MRKVGVIAGALTLGLLVATGVYSCRPSAPVAEDTVRRILRYRCPMHPSNTSDRPGRATDCGMEMVPVYADALPTGQPGSPAVMRVSEERQQLIGLRLGTVARSAVTHVVRALGRVTVDETRDYPVIAGADGWVQGVFPEATTGSTIRRGQRLATVSGRDYTTPQRTFLYALRALGAAPQDELPVDGFQVDPRVVVEEARLDLKKLGMDDARIDRLRATHQVELNVTLCAPAAGILVGRNAYPQQGFVRGTELFRIADLRRVWILADMFGDEASHLKPGTAVRVTLPGRPKTPFKATVGRALPLFDGNTRTLKVRLEIENPDLVLRPEMFVDLEFVFDMPEAVTVAASAVIESGLRRTVFVSRGLGVIEPREVETGWRFGDRVQIVRGLQPGETIVESGNYLLDSENRLRWPSTQPSYIPERSGPR